MSPYYLERRNPNKIGTRNGLLYQVISVHDKHSLAARELRRIEQEIIVRPRYRIMFREEACSECGKKEKIKFKLDELGLCITCADLLRYDYNRAYWESLN